MGSHDCSILFAFKVMTDADGVANLSVVVRFVSLGVVRRKAESYADWTFVNFNEVEFNHGNLISVG